MNQHSVRARANQKANDVARPVSSAGKDGMSIDPPNYGIDFLDSELSATAAVSGSAAAIQLKQAAGPGRQILTANVARPESTDYLPSNLKASIEHLSGIALDDVKVHYNSTKPTRLQAVAFARGANIYLTPGQEKHLPHEAWHVVQQKQGRVRPTNQINGIAINSNSGLENEASVMGAKAHGMISPYPRAMSQALPGQHVATQESGPSGLKAADARQTPPKAESSSSAVAQRFIGLELEFPIPVDKLGELTPEQEGLLRGPLTDKRKALQEEANLDKDTTILQPKDGFKVVVDHSRRRLGGLSQKKPAQVISPNILEFVFQPAVQVLGEVNSVLNKIYGKVGEISKATDTLTKRTSLKDSGGYYVGPVNTKGKTPDGLGTRAYSLQVNIGVETGSIAKFIGGFAGAPELQGEAQSQLIFRRCLNQARQAAEQLKELVRERQKTETRLSGLEGLFAIIALYLAAGKAEEDAPGTVKNFTPLLLKTPISSLVKNTLTEEEQEIWEANSKDLLRLLLVYVRGKTAKLTDYLVQSPKGRKAGAKVEDLITEDFKAPFIVSGKAIPAKEVGPKQPKGGVFETRFSSGDFGLNEAYQRAKEVFDLVEEAFWD
jgi:hypothetical protein